MNRNFIFSSYIFNDLTSWYHTWTTCQSQEDRKSKRCDPEPARRCSSPKFRFLRPFHGPEGEWRIEKVWSRSGRNLQHPQTKQEPAGGIRQIQRSFQQIHLFTSTRGVLSWLCDVAPVLEVVFAAFDATKVHILRSVFFINLFIICIFVPSME